MSFNRFHSEVGKQFSLDQKIKYYKKRMCDPTLPASKRLFAEQRLQTLSLQGNIKVKDMDFYKHHMFSITPYQEQKIRERMDKEKEWLAKHPEDSQKVKDIRGDLSDLRMQLEGARKVDSKRFFPYPEDERKYDEEVKSLLSFLDKANK